MIKTAILNRVTVTPSELSTNKSFFLVNTLTIKIDELCEKKDIMFANYFNI